MIPSLATPRLTLNAFTPADGPRVEHLAGAFEIADTTLSIPHPYPAGAAVEWIAGHADAWAGQRQLCLAIRLRDSGELIGACGYPQLQMGHQAEIGFWIGAPYWGQGYATEAAQALVDHAFATLDLRRVHAWHLARNPASGRVQQKIGLQPEGMRRQHVVKWEKAENVVMYGLLREEWLALRASR
ncbi:Protein N-acetyltransferase, RimJ/RimL family [Andreprevotia lacus DSM 23236]|jgi:RimJ/RimL family protein N-acetyltransferase|uniref:Protein N-acetyltransferase, RimJ/RimL family n=1 Tax=Andreprevotia lacus DSM 23236 TaxID=1121001 RepID=A0A1W1Y101_9NEIS|nr:GNAT family N-acetyltransferase [Andreprevotia lacus]SMC29822.1 Protein N-acetyltransferase, RimJ/RimL family [Andreprevotia lacus DSM 23236]